MPELVVELGCEELPASSVRRAYTQLYDLIQTELTEAQIPFTLGEPPLGTPRRLIVHFADVAEHQPDQTKEVRGPGIAGAFDAEDQPTKAVEGFCRSNGIEPRDLERRDGYVWAIRTLKGRPAIEVLAEAIPTAIRGLTFEKTMRWGSGRMRFARPIRWILASFGGHVVPFEIEGVASGLESRGHRFYSPETFSATSLDELLNGLFARKVEADPEERRKTIVEVATTTASGKPEFMPDLLEENVQLNEWPTPIEGSFNADFLELPEPVLVTAMAKHEKMFPVRDSGGRLLNKFIFVRNSGEDADVRAGAEWVLNARFNDAKFFFEEDRKKTLDEFLEATGRIVFQEKLGTVRQRADRLAGLAEWIAEQNRAEADAKEWARLAGLYAKADLATGLVSELASLQGQVGAEYGERHGLPKQVTQAIRCHYDLAKLLNGTTEGELTGLRLLVADQIDKLTGYLGLGMAPSGSSDPMGLRRAVTQCIEATWTRWDIDFAGLMAVSATFYATQGVELNLEGALGSAKAIFAQRTGALLEEHRYDLVEAAIMEGSGTACMRPMAVRTRLGRIEALAGDFRLIQTMTRPLNILQAAREKREPFESESPLSRLDRAALNSEEGRALAAVLDEFNSEAGLESLAQPIHEFFEKTMVMSADSKERFARLTLVAAACERIEEFGDLTKIVTEN
jgi:glycyl-tRNA synthetase beta chain